MDFTRHRSNSQPLMSDSLEFSRLGEGRSGLFHCQPAWTPKRSDGEWHRCNSGSHSRSAIQGQPDALPLFLGCHPYQSPPSNGRIHGTAPSDYIAPERQLIWSHSSIPDAIRTKDRQLNQPSPNRHIRTSFHKLGRGVRGSVTALLPPIDLDSPAKHQSLSRLRWKELDAANESRFFPTPCSYHCSCSSSGLQDLRADGPMANKTTDILCPQRRLIYFDGSLGRKTLRKTSRSQELRPQAVEGSNTSRISPHTDVTAGLRPNPSGHDESSVRHPVTTPGRNPRIRFDPSSSEASIAQAV